LRPERDERRQQITANPLKINVLKLKNQHKMKKVFQTLCAAAIVAVALASCSTTRNTGNEYQKHLSHKHTGGHYLNTNNRGCNWNR
jgi:predicted component of type VI protein secretion system